MSMQSVNQSVAKQLYISECSQTVSCKAVAYLSYTNVAVVTMVAVQVVLLAGIRSGSACGIVVIGGSGGSAGGIVGSDASGGNGGSGWGTVGIAGQWSATGGSNGQLK